MRENGKVVSLDIELKDIDNYDQIIIVDDILGGGATIQMLIDEIIVYNYSSDIHLWVAYNEDIHSEEFLDQFDSCYLGEEI